MALELSGERPAIAASFRPLRALAAWLTRARAERARRAALAYLLRLESYRLADMGINRSDLFDATYARTAPGRRPPVPHAPDINP